MNEANARNGSLDVAVLRELADTIAARRGGDGDTSYTAKLLNEGVERCARKFGEEALELVIASLKRDDDEIAAEAADVVYHLLVLLEACDVPLNEALAILRQRQGVGGLVEKTARGMD